MRFPLVSRSGLWHGRFMTNSSDKPGPKAGGAIIALSILLGFGVGIGTGQPSLGVVGGFLAGTAIAVVIWLRDRRN